MAARKQSWHTDDVRQKIKTSQLINRLMSHVNGEVDLSRTQVAAIKILLGKSLPDLQSIALTDADHTGPAKLEITWARD